MESTTFRPGIFKLYGFGPYARSTDGGRGNALGLNRFTMLTVKYRYRRMRESGLSATAARGIIFDLLFAASTGEPVFYSRDNRTGGYFTIG